jgi:hypothetical protein
MPVNWMEVLLGATNIGKSLQNIKAFNELRNQRDVENTQPIEDWIKKYGYTPELGKLGPEFDRYLKSRGINLPRTNPQGASGQPDAPYDIPSEPVNTAESRTPDTSLLGRMIGAQKSQGRGYVTYPDPTHEQIIEREKLGLMKEKGKARQQAEISAGITRSTVDQEKFDLEKGRIRMANIHSLMTEKPDIIEGDKTRPATTKDLESYVNDVMEGKKPSVELSVPASEAKLYQQMVQLSSSFSYLHGKNIHRTPLTDIEQKALTILSQKGKAKLSADGDIELIETTEPKRSEHPRPPDPKKGENLDPAKWEIVDNVINGKVTSSLARPRVALPTEDKPESWQGKGIERAVMTHLQPEMYEAWKASQPTDMRSIQEFMSALTGGFKGEQPSLATGLSYLPKERQREINSDIIRAAELMRSDKLDEYAAYNKAVWERAGKKGETNPNKETKSDIDIPPEKAEAVRRRLEVLKKQGKNAKQRQEIIITELHEGKL